MVVVIIGGPKLSVGVIMDVNGCVSLSVNPVIDSCMAYPSPHPMSAMSCLHSIENLV